jgi:hypothetical protein
MCVGANWVPVFLLLATSTAFSQRGGAKDSINSLPEAPSELTSAKPFQQYSVDLDAPRIYILQAASEAFYRLDSGKEQVNNFLSRQLLLARASRNFSSSESGSTLGRAMNAASHTFVSRTSSGKGKLNTSYFFGVLTSAVVHTAYRPYWNRPVSAPFSDFGSTVGNDAGMNLLHEFGPGLEQLMKSHAPKFLSRFEAGIGRH